jgi:hypothetical protein
MTMESTTLPSSDQVICTLYEGDYHIGVAVLINSIVMGGYRGLFWVGYRGELPPWTAQLRRKDGLYQVGEALLGFESIDRGFHFTQFKPEFMDSLIERGIARKYIWYFDPDITVRCDWSFYERWVRFGVCLCQEITLGVMASDHPIRCEWMELAQAAGWTAPVRQQERYYNGGFVGMHVEHREFLNTWVAANRLANSAGVDPANIKQGMPGDTFFCTDQDTLNMTTMYSKAPLTTLGPEGMGFVAGGFTMYHTVGGAKPWRRKFLRDVLQGSPPGNNDKHFLECAEGPIQPYTSGKLKKMRRAAQWAALIGRFYRRG